MNTENASPQVLQEFMDEMAKQGKDKLQEVVDECVTLAIFSKFALEDMSVKDKDIFTGHKRAKHLYQAIIRFADKVKSTKKWKINDTSKLISAMEMHSDNLNGEIEAFIKWSGSKNKLPDGWNSSMKTHLRNKMLADKIISLMKELYKILVFYQMARRQRDKNMNK